jgi:hypothetical protein
MGASQLPSEAYAATLTAVRAAPEILGPIVAASPPAQGGSGTVAGASAFVLEVVTGGRAYDGPPAEDLVPPSP